MNWNYWFTVAKSRDRWKRPKPWGNSSARPARWSLCSAASNNPIRSSRRIWCPSSRQCRECRAVIAAAPTSIAGTIDGLHWRRWTVRNRRPLRGFRAARDFECAVLWSSIPRCCKEAWLGGGRSNAGTCGPSEWTGQYPVCANDSTPSTKEGIPSRWRGIGSASGARWRSTRRPRPAWRHRRSIGRDRPDWKCLEYWPARELATARWPARS